MNKSPGQGTLPIHTVLQIRSLKINRKKMRKNRGGRCRWPLLSNYSNKNNNNITVTTSAFRDSKTSRNQMSIGLANVRSIKGKDEIIYRWMKNNFIKILLLTETWLTDDDAPWIQSSILNREHFEISTVNCIGKRGGGVALVHDRSIKTQLKQSGTYENLFEYGLWYCNIYKTLTLKILGIYHPPPSKKSYHTDQQFIDGFLNFYSECSLQNKDLLILGDFNMPFNKLLENTDIEQFKDATEAIGLKQYVDFTTHVKGNILDHIYLDQTSKIKLTNIASDHFFSDHRSIKFNINITIQDLPTRTKTKRDWLELAPSTLYEHFDVDALDYSHDNLQEFITEFNTKFVSAIDKCIPEYSKTIKTKSEQPWFGRPVKQFRKLLRLTESHWLRNKSPYTWNIYKDTRNAYKKTIRTAKKIYYTEVFKKYKNNAEQLYKLVSKLTGSIKHNPMPSDYDSDKTLADTFANYFTEKIENIRKNLSHFSEYLCPDNRNNIITKLHCFQPISSTEVRETIMQLKNKTCELDIMPTSFLKENLEYLMKPIKHIINLSQTTSSFIDEWKCAILRPLIKKKGNSSILNFRPVSNLPFISKVVEKCVQNQYNEYCNINNLQSEFQSAYKQLHSCETLLLKLVNDILWAMENSKLSNLVMCDLSGAFDTVQHSILLSILERKFGITDEALLWFQNYLADRQFKVSVNKEYSDIKHLSYSVPQGSINGPILWNAYSSTIINCINNSYNIDLYAFADDHSLHNSAAPTQQDISLSHNKLSDTMDSVQDWMNSNRLKLNPSKTEFIVFGSLQLLQKSKHWLKDIKICGSTIELSTVVRYLGAWLDQLLNFKKHITIKCGIAMRNLQLISRIRHLLDQSSCEILISSLVMSHLDYANGILYGLPHQTLKKIQRVQNMAAKLILKRSK